MERSAITTEEEYEAALKEVERLFELDTTLHKWKSFAV